MPTTIWKLWSGASYKVFELHTLIKVMRTEGFEPSSQVGGEPLVIYRQSSTIELRSQGRVKVPEPYIPQDWPDIFATCFQDTVYFSPLLLKCYCYLSLGTRIFAIYPSLERQDSNLQTWLYMRVLSPQYVFHFHHVPKGVQEVNRTKKMCVWRLYSSLMCYSWTRNRRCMCCPYVLRVKAGSTQLLW